MSQDSPTNYSDLVSERLKAWVSTMIAKQCLIKKV